MRKVKVLAFVLAALMVVAAFAGCGTKQLKTDVSTLDERVTALEELLKQVNSTVNNAATADQINELLEAITANKAEAAAGDKALADAIAKITADQTAANDKLKADLEKLVNDVKADQKTGDTALQVAIEKLNNSLAATNKALEDSIEDLLEKIEDGDEDLSDAIVETNKALADAIAAINKAQDAQGKDVADALAASNKALEDAIKALQESTKASDDAIREDLLDAIEAITAAQNKQGEDLAAALKETNDALAAAIESLKGEINTGDDAVRAELIAAIEALTKKQEEQNNAIADALAGLKETIEQNKENAGANASLQAAISKYVSDLTVAKTTYDFNQVHYTTSDFNAITKAITSGIATVQAATTVETAKVAYDAAVVELAKYERVDVALYNDYVALRGKVTLDSWDAIKAYEKAAAAADEHYGDYGSDYSPVERYYYQSGKYYALLDEVKELKDAYYYLEDTFVPAVEKLIADINAIERVQIKTLYADEVGEKDIPANIVAVNTAKNTYNSLKNYVNNTSTGHDGLYIDNSMINLVTNVSVLNNHIATANALTEAVTVLVTYGTENGVGGYNNIFSDYIGVTPAAKRAWFEYESKYKNVNSRINSWLTAYPVVDAQNAEAILNAYLAERAQTFTYAKYLADQAEMKLFLAAYNEFVSELVPRIKNVNKFTEVSTDNVKTYVELVKDIADWRIVIEDVDTDDNDDPELYIKQDQYERMVNKQFSRNNPFQWADRPDGVVTTFFTKVIGKAQEVANEINKEIDTLQDLAATAVSLEDYKALEGYKDLDSDGIYEIDASGNLFVDDGNGGLKVNPDVNIAMFKAAYIIKEEDYSYDLTTLLDLDELAAAEKTVEANIAYFKTVSDKIHANLDAVIADLAKVEEIDLEKVTLSHDEKIELLKKATLNNETVVNQINTDYTDLVSKGFKADSTRVWTPVLDKTGAVVEGQFKNVDLLNQDDVYEVTRAIGTVSALRKMANNLSTFIDLVNKANTYFAFTVDNINDRTAFTQLVTQTVWDSQKSQDKTVYEHKFIKTANVTCAISPDGKLTDFSLSSNGVAETTKDYTSKSAPTSVYADSMKQRAAVELVWKAYYAFIKANGGNTEAKVETAMAKGMEDLKLMAIKNVAFKLVADMTNIPAAWDDSKGVYGTQKDIVVNSISKATSYAAIAEILNGFYELTEVPYTTKVSDTETKDGIWFAGKEVFHADGKLHYEVEKPLVCPNCGK